jgi:hypothetical protein
MAERVDYVTVGLTDGDVPLLWEVRQQLMARLEHVESTGRIRASFAAVGASGRRIELTWGQKAALLAALADWAASRDGYAAMPSQLYMLRNLLIEVLVSVGDLRRSGGGD